MDITIYSNMLGNGNEGVFAVFERDGRILHGLRHYEWDKKELGLGPSWTIPGGRCSAGETLERSLRREVAEETGITEFCLEDYLGSVQGVKAGDVVHLFKCTTEQEATIAEPEKFSEWSWIPVEEVRKKNMNAEVVKLILSSEQKVK